MRNLRILSWAALGMSLTACGSDTSSLSAISPSPTEGDRVSTIFFDDTDRVRLRDVALSLAAINVPDGDRETLATAANALLRSGANVTADDIVPEPVISDFDFANPEGEIDLLDVATLQAALALAPRNRTASNLATTGNRLFFPDAPLNTGSIRVIPGEGIPVPVPSSQPSVAPTPNPAQLATLLATSECIECQLQGANLSATAIATDLEGFTLRESDISFANLTAATLVAGDLTSAIAIGVTAIETDFREATLFNADFREASLRGAAFGSSGLSGAIFTGVDLRAADFSDADLTDTNLTAANLSDAVFANATFERTQLDRAILVRADFSGVTLTATDLTAADLRGANLSSANFADATVRNALYDDTTQFPAGFDPEQAGMQKRS